MKKKKDSRKSRKKKMLIDVAYKMRIDRLRSIIINRRRWNNSSMVNEIVIEDIVFDDLCVMFIDFKDVTFRNVDFTNSQLYRMGITFRECLFVDCNFYNSTFPKKSIPLCQFINCEYIYNVCPSSGEFIGYKNAIYRTGIFKKTKRHVILELKIPDNANRESGTTEVCKCDAAYIKSVRYIDGTKLENPRVRKLSFYDNSGAMIYTIGTMIRYQYYREKYDCDFDTVRNGILFYMTFEDALRHIEWNKCE